MLEKVLVREWMTAPVISANGDLPINEAHQIMTEYGIRRLPVLDDGRLVGIVTIGDVREASPSDATTLSIWELNYLWGKLTVDKVMSRNVQTVAPDATMIDAAELMLDLKISGLPVVDAQNQLVGIITESDIFRMLVKSRSAAPIAPGE